MLSNITYEELEAKIRKGKDIEDIAKEFSWQDFEGIVSEAFSANAFRTFRNFRFSSNKKRYEVDVIAIYKPRMILADSMTAHDQTVIK